MTGVCIADPISGRKILSTHFQIPLRASLAIESALNSTTPITWVPNFDNITVTNNQAEGDSKEDDGKIWSNNNNNNNNNNNRRLGGVAVCQIERNGLRYIAPISSDVDPILPLAFLHQLHLVLESYIGGPVNEASLKDNFDLVLELLEEMLSSGRPVLSESSQLRELVEPPTQLLAKVANVAGLSLSNVQSSGTALLSSPLPWRRTGIKYSSNEIYIDITETLDYLLEKSGKVLNGSIRGETNCRSKLSGMPDLVLSFNDPGLIEDCSFHNSVRYSRWGKDKVVSFIPPDGSFTLQKYLLSPPSSSKSSLSSHSNSDSQAHLTHFLPLIIKPNLTTGSLGSSLSISLTSLTTASNILKNLELRFFLGKEISSFVCSLSGGRGSGSGGGIGSVGGGDEEEKGKGRFEVEERRDGSGVELIWFVGELMSSDRSAELNCQFLNLNNSKPASTLNITFETLTSIFSGLRIAGLTMKGETYNVYKGVKLRGVGKVEVRC